MQADLRPANTTQHFYAPWWLRNAHLQTIFAKYLSPKHKLVTEAEIFTLRDGDHLQLNWSEKLAKTEQRPLVILLHGLAGDINSHYIQGLMAALKQQGLPCVLMHFRGCNGQPNKLARAYHSGDTADLAEVIGMLQQRFPKMPLSAVGFSLGANVLVKYCGEQAEQNPLRAAVAVCPPLSLAACAKRINQGSSKIYQSYLLKRLKAATLQKLASHPKFPLPLTPEQIQGMRSIEEFDEHYTAPIHGFFNAKEYYQRASGMAFLKQIHIPTLIIHAKDDPFLTDAVIPQANELSPFIDYQLCQNGGHVGFVNGRHPLKPQFWLNTRIPAFLLSHLPQ
ncbi:alpha/beta hydrolase [Alishewanella longhuensis]|uniref:Alpha/beta hydrolase n=1 Tax=Alishewanella longhuensis TaxID=1091037 RepID=A0ABQ3L1X0_9ALTE|nr:hydrolase [Alishewanella longhuensis]GHG75302.1 alpha/beta hydrolase [Alishewanella longhuensis]